ncbi:beta-ketoacyl-[acyl-carrier-protein] synthase family protein [Paludibacterium paludis]|nr:beta-ketoacyl-[acyl-carrier-protein] synthase family protein [Paludibacterium paludis]
MTKPATGRVVVTGLGVVAPNGLGHREFWNNCMAGRPGIRKITAFPTDGLTAKIAGIVEGFTPGDWRIPKALADRTDRYVHFAMAASAMAVEHARLDAGTLAGERTGVCIATAIAGTPYMERVFLASTERATGPVDSHAVPADLYLNAGFNGATSAVAGHYGAAGPVMSLATGCTAGLDALGYALDCIRAGDADIMLAGASEAPLTPLAMAAFDVIGALTNSRNDCPERASRPFDKTRDGFVLGEGSGVLVLESYEHARARGARILAELSGFGSTCNAYHMTDLPPDGEALCRAAALAVEDAGISPEAIDHVNAHGSSTPQNDANESFALVKLMGDHAKTIPVCSLKSMNGHALSAANAIEAVACVLSLMHQEVPPTINYEEPDPDCFLDYVPNIGRKASMDHVLKTASGFSGIHSAVVFRRYRDEESQS